MESSGTQGTLSQGTTPIFFIIMVITSLAEALISPNLIPDLPAPLHLPNSAGAWEETLAPASESAPDPVSSLALPCLLPSSLGTLAPVPSSVQPGPGSALPGFSVCVCGGGFRPGSASSAKAWEAHRRSGTPPRWSWAGGPQNSVFTKAIVHTGLVSQHPGAGTLVTKCITAPQQRRDTASRRHRPRMFTRQPGTGSATKCIKKNDKKETGWSESGWGPAVPPSRGGGDLVCLALSRRPLPALSPQGRRPRGGTALLGCSSPGGGERDAGCPRGGPRLPAPAPTEGLLLFHPCPRAATW